jgi:probable phosphoglycerate mutase
VVAVCHGLLLDSLYRAAHAMPLDARRSVDLFNASLNTFHYSASVWRMESWGDVEHLNENASVYVGD